VEQERLLLKQLSNNTGRDDIKNRVLQANNIPIHRFKTNESNEKRRLGEIVKRFSH
jgi:hypothetical protein